MVQAQQDTLVALVGRALTAQEIAQIDLLLPIRNDVRIAEILSVGRAKYGPTQIGTGTVLAVMGSDTGGAFLDDVNNVGSLDRGVYWGFDPVRRGVLDLSIAEARAGIAKLKGKTMLTKYSDGIDKLLLVGVVPDPISHVAVSAALNKAEGRATL